jgi:Tfp pilus assembly protein PilF
MDCIRQKLFALCLFVCCFALELEAQHFVNRERALQVQVVDQDNLGLFARVTLRNYESSDLVAETDRAGMAVFHGIPAGEYTLVVTVNGHEMHRDQISLMEENLRSELVRLNLRSPYTASDQVISVQELTIPRAAQEHYNVGKKAIDAHDWQAALRAFNKAIKRYPVYARALNAKGVVLALMNKSKEAESVFRISIEANPKFAESHFNLGKLLLESNRISEARMELERSLELGYSKDSAIVLLVESMFLTNDEASAALVIRSIHLKRVAHTPGLHLELGSALEDLSKLQLAAEQYSLVLTENASQGERLMAEAALSRINDRLNIHRQNLSGR